MLPPLAELPKPAPPVAVPALPPRLDAPPVAGTPPVAGALPPLAEPPKPLPPFPPLVAPPELPGAELLLVAVVPPAPVVADVPPVPDDTAALEVPPVPPGPTEVAPAEFTPPAGLPPVLEGGFAMPLLHAAPVRRSTATGRLARSEKRRMDPSDLEFQ
jgi:hypothetical protein